MNSAKGKRETRNSKLSKKIEIMEKKSSGREKESHSEEEGNAYNDEDDDDDDDEENDSSNKTTLEEETLNFLRIARSIIRRRMRAASTQQQLELIAAAFQDKRGTVSGWSVYLFFSGTYLLTISFMLILSGTWSFLVRIPEMHLTENISTDVVKLTNCILVAGALTLPASCIAFYDHNINPQRRTFIMIISLLFLTLIFLSSAYVYAIKFHYKFSGFSPGPNKRLQCCGVTDGDDWINFTNKSEPPPSCRSAFLRKGCLNAITLDLAWMVAYVHGLTLVAIVTYLFIILSSGILWWRLLHEEFEIHWPIH